MSALSVTAVSFALSSAVSTPTLAAFAFAALWFIPHLGSFVVSLASDLPFLRFTSLPALLSALADPWLDPASEATRADSAIALTVLTLLSALALAFAEQRIRQASAQG